MQSTLAEGITHVRFRIFAGAPTIHAVAGRSGGVSASPYASLNLGWSVGDGQTAVAENRRRLYRSLGLDPTKGAVGRQVHQNRVVAIEHPAGALIPEQSVPDTDALLTDRPGVGLLVIAADCVPLLFCDPVRRVVGTAHAGWRGTVQNIAARAVEAMTAQYRSRPDDILVGIGPSIGRCCYEVDAPVLGPLRDVLPDDYPDLIEPVREGHARIDLWESNRRLLLAAGIPAGNIEVAGLCTACNKDTFFSERALGRPSGRFGAVIALPE